MRKYLISLVLGLSLTAGAIAQNVWPERPIKLVVGAAPGGSNDFVARVLSEGLADALGQPVVVENKPGAGSSMGALFVAKASPDGYTVLVAPSASISINPALDPKFAPARTLIPVAKVSSSPVIITVNSQLGIKSVSELIEYAKKNPGKLNYAHSGVGTAPHLGGVLFNQLAGIDLVPIGFKGGGPAVMSVMSGDTHVTFATPPSVMPLFDGGKLTGLAVSSPNRFALAPELPSMVEAGLPDFKVDLWYGVFLPLGTPPDIVKKLFDATNAVAQTPEVKKAMETGGMEVSVLPSSAEFAKFVDEQNRVLGKLAKESGAKVD